MGSANEQLLDKLIGHEVDLNQLSNSQVAIIVKILNGNDAKLRAALIEVIDGLGTNLSAAAVDAALAPVIELNSNTFAAINAEMASATSGLIKYEIAFQKGAMQAVIPALVQDIYPIKAPNFSQVQALVNSRPFQGKLLKEWMAGIESDRAVSIRDAIRSGVVDGRTTADIVRTIMGTRAEQYADGILQKPRREVEAVVRSAISHTAETASEKSFEANSDIISHVEWLSTLDTRTTDKCIIRDRKPYTLVTYKPIGHEIPWLAGPGKIHWCCRSTKLPILKDARSLGIKDAAARASMDGQVPKEMNYAEWLTKQSAARQDEVLGPTRGKMMREGDLKVGVFFNDKGQFLTLDQLNERLN
jgi:hypothetical protein